MMILGQIKSKDDRKGKAAPSLTGLHAFAPLCNPEKATAMVSVFDPNQRALTAQALQMMQGSSSSCAAADLDARGSCG